MKKSSRNIGPGLDEQQSSLTEAFEADRENFQNLVRRVKDYAIFFVEPSGHIKTWNDGAQRIIGYAPDEILGRHVSILYPIQVAAAGQPQRNLERAASLGPFRGDDWRVRRNGTPFWANISITCLKSPDGRILGFVMVIRDQMNEILTAQKLHDSTERCHQLETRVEELEGLLTRALAFRDEEWKRVAKALRESLGNDLATIREALETGFTSAATKAAEKALQTARDISDSLYPETLETLGLQSAIERLASRLRVSTVVDIEVVSIPAHLPRISHEIEITAFRIVEAALASICSHSACPTVRIEIERKPDALLLRIRDHGRGFFPLPDGIPARRGIAEMKHRALHFGGEFTISAADPGTLVEVLLPIQAETFQVN